ncbi:Hypothetical predicted protein [Paramuricea clavata]|uniref:Uncharacterized protein n=1 Tax=Paramuricea clavata TaxID=317549 RepID=A0A7D9HQ43_PARCT|nr:Hypothetical predicted protein [Paramuricea clavata]
MQFISLSVVVFCLCLATSALYEANGKDVVIFRGKRDRFTNVFGCNVSNAICSDESCADCQCMMDQIFVWTRGQYGKCVPNELIVYATSYEASFLVQNNLSKSCTYQKFLDHTTFVLESSILCNDKNRDSRWIWTNFGQILNWETLECMTDDFIGGGRHYPTMKKCDKSTDQKQLWECVGDKKYDIIQSLSRRYMYYGEVTQFVTTKNTQPSNKTKWKRFGSEKDVCSQAVGCQTFADGSSLVILNKTKCEKESECLGEKEIKFSKAKCLLLPNKTQYLHNDTWKALEKKNGNFFISSSANKVSLKWNLTKTPKSWGGLMVKVQFMCETIAATKTEHCVVIKYTGTFTGFCNDDEDSGDGEDGGGEDGDGDDGDDKDGDSGIDNTNKDKTDKDTNGGDKDNTQTVVIIVCVVVALLLSGVIVFIIYKHRNRFFLSRKRNTERQDVPPNEEYANAMNQLYPANNNISQRECELYESTPNHVYQYVDVDHKNVAPPPQNLTYDYAFVDGPLTKSERSSVELDATAGGKDTSLEDDDKEEQTGETNNITQSTKLPPHKYHVLEGP